MELSPQRIKEIYQEKIALFSELLRCVEQERDNLIDVNTHNLWTLLKEKQKIIRSIEKLDDSAKDSMILNNIPPQDKRTIDAFSQKLSHIREEIKVRVRENMTFIQESLDFFHEIISVFSTAGMPEDSYHPIRNNRKQMPSRIYHNEV